MRLFSIILVLFAALLGLGTALVGPDGGTPTELSADLSDVDSQGESEQEPEDERDDDDASASEYTRPLARLGADGPGRGCVHGDSPVGAPLFRPPIA